VGAVVYVHAKGMKEPWCLATSDTEATATVLVNRYAKRWTIEPQFRDTKDLRIGMGLSATRIGEPVRRPAAVGQRLRGGPVDIARRDRREPRYGQIAQIQHQQDPHALLGPPRLHAL